MMHESNEPEEAALRANRNNAVIVVAGGTPRVAAIEALMHENQIGGVKIVTAEEFEEMKSEKILMHVHREELIMQTLMIEVVDKAEELVRRNGADAYPRKAWQTCHGPAKRVGRSK